MSFNQQKIVFTKRNLEKHDSVLPLEVASVALDAFLMENRGSSLRDHASRVEILHTLCAAETTMRRD